jgi:hypothetical protein
MLEQVKFKIDGTKHKKSIHRCELLKLCSR